MAVSKMGETWFARSRARRTTRLNGRMTSIAAVVGVLGASVLVGVAADTPASAARLVLTVDSAGDAPDAVPGDGLCRTAAGACTLRAAMEESEATAGADTIEFSIGSGVQRISLNTALPLINDPDGVTIDATTQPGARVNTQAVGSDAIYAIEVQGAGPDAFDGFDLRSSGSVITGLALFDLRVAVRMIGPTANGNRVVGNSIGTDSNGLGGQPARVIGASGVMISFGASGNVVGAPGPANRNLIAGNGDHGVALFDDGTDANSIQNNLFGLSRDGLIRVTNHGHGVDVNFNSSANLIGGLGSGEGNVISGSGLSGVEISHDAGAGTTRDNFVAGNLIGTTPDGRRAPEYARNIQFGVNLEGNARCTSTCDDDVSYNRVEANVIVGSNVDVIIWKGAHHNIVIGNSIGVLADGAVAESSFRSAWGVLIATGAHDNRIEANTISGVQRGIHVRPDNLYPSACRPSDQVCPQDATFATDRNTFSANSIADITNGMGIDLYAQAADGSWIAGPSPTPSALSNGGIEAPRILSATSTFVVIETCPGCRVELFTTPEPTCEQCWGEYGRGRDLVAAGTANSNGRLSLSAASATAGTSVAAHATDRDGNTSEHSLRVLVGEADGIGNGAIPVASATRCALSADC